MTWEMRKAEIKEEIRISYMIEFLRGMDISDERMLKSQEGNVIMYLKRNIYKELFDWKQDSSHHLLEVTGKIRPMNRCLLK